MIYKIKMMSGVEVPLESEDAVADFLKEANSGKKLIITKYGIVNVASIDSIGIHKEKMASVNELMTIGRTLEQAEKEVLGVSPFAKLLSDKMAMLSPGDRTKAQEEAARNTRRGN